MMPFATKALCVYLHSDEQHLLLSSPLHPSLARSVPLSYPPLLSFFISLSSLWPGSEDMWLSIQCQLAPPPLVAFIRPGASLSLTAALKQQ